VLDSALYGAHHTTDIRTAARRNLLRPFRATIWKSSGSQNYFPDDAALVVTGNIKLAH